MPGCRCRGRGDPAACGRLVCSGAGALEHAREAAGVLVGVVVASKLLRL